MAGQLNPSRIPIVQVGELDPKYSCLNVIQAAIGRNLQVLVFLFLAVVAQEAYASGDVGIIGH